MTIAKKRSGYGFQMTTKIGRSKASYLFIKDTYGAYHVFAEVDAKKAAADCGVKVAGKNTRQACAAVFKL